MLASANQLSHMLARVADRDRAAFAAVYGATSAKLLGIILRIVKRRELAEEILQEVYVTVWQKAAEFDASRASPITWLAAIARNRALDLMRKATPVSIEDMPEVLDLASNEEHPLDAIARSQDLARLMRCLDGLEPERRDIVLLAYREGLSREQLAERFGRPVPTIKTWLHRSLVQLRHCLAS
jgi:RNA polymerase sigma-70 factor (ECF subfamily)